MPVKPVICLVGCGQTGDFLIQRLKNGWHLSVIEKDDQRLAELKTRYKEEPEIEFIEGDGSSAVVLERAEIHRAYQVLITVADDNASEEIAELLVNRFEKRNIIVRITDPEKAARLRNLGTFVVNPFETMSNFIINQINLGETIAFNIGKGEGEIVQIELTQTSPLAGKALKDLPPRPWIIGAIYRPRKRLKLDPALPYFRKLQISREDELIIPSGRSIPRVGDKIILIGDPHILRATAQYLKAGAPVFPIRHGENIIAMFLEDEKDRGAYKEFRWLLKRMEPCQMHFIYKDKGVREVIDRVEFPDSWHKQGYNRRDVQRLRLRSIPKFIRSHGMGRRIGLIIYREPKSTFTRLFHRIFLLSGLIKTVRELSTPVWIIRNRGNIHGVVLYVSAGEETLQAAELAIDAALKFHLPLKAVQVNPPGIIAGSVQLRNSQKMLQNVREVAALYGLTLHETVREGNPVYETIKLVQTDHLLVMAYSKDSGGGFLIPNTSRLLLKRFKGSVLTLAT